MPVATMLPLSAAPSGAASLRNDDDLDRRFDALEDVDVDHERAQALDGFVEADLVLVDAYLTGGPDGVGEVGVGDRPIEPLALAGAGADGDDRLVERGRHVDGLVGGARFAGLAFFHAAADFVEPAGVGHFGQTLGQKVVAGVAGRHVGEVALYAHAFDVFEQNDLHDGLLAVSVRQESHFAGALDGHRDLALMTAAGAGYATRADLAFFGDEALEDRVGLVVDVLDLLYAVVAVAAARLAQGSGLWPLLATLALWCWHAGLSRSFFFSRQSAVGRPAGRFAARWWGRSSERDVLVAEVAFGDIGGGAGELGAGLARGAATFARPDELHVV